MSLVRIDVELVRARLVQLHEARRRLAVAQVHAVHAASLPAQRTGQGHGGPDMHEPAGVGAPAGSTTVPVLAGESSGCSHDGRA